MENKEDVCFKLVKWRKPKEMVININIDGSMTAGKWGCGIILRNVDGNFVACFAGPLSNCSVPYVELMALYQVVKIALSNGFLRVWIEVDALLVLNFLNYDNYRNSKKFFILREIKGMLSKMNYVISDIWREGLTKRFDQIE